MNTNYTKSQLKSKPTNALFDALELAVLNTNLKQIILIYSVLDNRIGRAYIDLRIALDKKLGA